MMICWDNLESMIYRPDRGEWQKGIAFYVYMDSCLECSEPYLARSDLLKLGNGLFCCGSCSKKGKNNPWYDKKLSIETRKKMSEAHKGKNCYWYGKHHSEESKQKMSESNKGEKNNQWKGGYYNKNIPLYDTYATQLDWCEKVRRNKEDKNILEVKCSYNECNKWFIPTINMVGGRIKCLNGKSLGESRFYCSDHCKKCCPIYHKTLEALMKEDAVRAGRDPWWEMVREVQPQLRQMVLKRDDYKCTKCGSIEDLHCHHVEGILWEPLTSADIDMCITVCKDCHEEIHKKEGCGYKDMKCNGGK